MSRVAIIDMGTNTFHLLIVDLIKGKGHTQILKEKQPVLLGEKGLTEGFLTPEALQRGMDALTRFSALIEEHNVAHTTAIATSAVRSSKNGKAWLQDVLKKTGIEVEVIDGDREAELIWKGVRESMPLKDTSLIMDIGGGSTEFIIGNSKHVFYKQSFPLGVSRLLDRFSPQDPMTREDEQNVWNHLSEYLQPLQDALREFPCSALIGSSGSYDSLLEVMRAAGDLPLKGEYDHAALMDKALFARWSQALKRMTEVERRNVSGLIPLRARMIHMSCIIIEYVLELSHFQQMYQSDFALKEGMIAELTERL